MKKTIVSAGLCFVLLMLVSAPLRPPEARGASGVRWYDYREAKSLAKEEGKQVYLYFRSDRCTYCSQMEKETLSAPEVVRFLNRNFVAARIDSDRSPDLAADYRVMGLPTSYFLAADGRRIGGLPGFQQPERFLAFLRFLESESYRKMSFGEFLKR